jgi:hypothetical protein
MPITPNSARAYYGLQATAEPTKTQVSGAVTIGVPSSVLTLTGATKAYCVSATLATASDTLTIDTETGIATIGTAPVAQVETATVVAAGGATSSGNLAVTVTAARVTGSPLAFSVALVSGVDTTATLIAAKIRTAFNANTALTAVYTVGGTGVDVTLTEKIATNNDGTLNIAIAAGLGVSAIVSSTNTTAGVGGVKLTNGTGDGKDFEGASLGTMSNIHGFIFKNTGTGGLGVEIGTGDYATGIVAGDIATMFSTVGRTNLIGNLQFQALDDSAAVEVTIIAQ